MARPVTRAELERALRGLSGDARDGAELLGAVAGFVRRLVEPADEQVARVPGFAGDGHEPGAGVG